mmetsp:Transcript_11921/g.26502  ORF Transcript_11921/g.26502 Transcript_11921/m.26502 type:complete len:410 (+) Transcript_11921:2266-3495(+)
MRGPPVCRPRRAHEGAHLPRRAGGGRVGQGTHQGVYAHRAEREARAGPRDGADPCGHRGAEELKTHGGEAQIQVLEEDPAGCRGSHTEQRGGAPGQDHRPRLRAALRGGAPGRHQESQAVAGPTTGGEARLPAATQCHRVSKRRQPQERHRRARLRHPALRHSPVGPGGRPAGPTGGGAGHEGLPGRCDRLPRQGHSGQLRGRLPGHVLRLRGTASGTGTRQQTRTGAPAHRISRGCLPVRGPGRDQPHPGHLHGAGHEHLLQLGHRLCEHGQAEPTRQDRGRGGGAQETRGGGGEAEGGAGSHRGEAYGAGVRHEGKASRHDRLQRRGQHQDRAAGGHTGWLQLPRGGAGPLYPGGAAAHQGREVAAAGSHRRAAGEGGDRSERGRPAAPLARHRDGHTVRRGFRRAG